MGLYKVMTVIIESMIYDIVIFRATRFQQVGRLFPANFDPDRWLSQKSNSGDAADEENDEKTTNESAPQTRGLLYFGIGSRSCVGKEFAKLFLRIFLLEFARTCDVNRTILLR